MGILFLKQKLMGTLTHQLKEEKPTLSIIFIINDKITLHLAIPPFFDSVFR